MNLEERKKEHSDLVSYKDNIVLISKILLIVTEVHYISSNYRIILRKD